MDYPVIQGDISAIDDRELTAQERAAIVTWRIANGARLTIKDIMIETGLTYSGVLRMMYHIERATGIYRDDDTRQWAVVEN